MTKEDYITILAQFNLDFYLDYDQWDEKGWIRMCSERTDDSNEERKSKDDWFKPLIIYKDDKDNMHRIGRYVYAMGRYSVKKQIKALTNLGSL